MEMTIVEKLINRKLSLTELAEYLSNVSEACRIQGVSRQSSYDIKKACEEGGIEGLKEKTAESPISRTVLLRKWSSGSYP